MQGDFYPNRSLSILKKTIPHGLLTFGHVYEILVFTVRREIAKIAKKRELRMGTVTR